MRKQRFPAVARLCGASSSVMTSRSKKSLRAAHEPPTWRGRVGAGCGSGVFDPARLVFIDETAANTKMMRVGGRCVRGERLIGRVPNGHWKTIAFVGALRCN